MKKLFTLFIGLSLMAVTAAQTDAGGRCTPEWFDYKGFAKGKDVIGDFTITDTEGNVLNLYDHLDQGKTVFIDLFFTTCGYCQQYSPIIEQVYQNTGAGQGNILMWGISPTDNNAQIDAYKVQFGITNPCAGTEGNGPAAINVVIDGQNFLGYPTYCVVCPDRTLYFDVCYPPSVSCFDPYFDNCAQTVLIAGFTSDVTGGCSGFDVAFTDESIGEVTSWSWTFEGGDPAGSAEQNPTVTYTSPGMFDVELTVSNANNSNTLLMEDYITVHELPAVTLEPFEDVCIYDPAFELTGGQPEGGEYSGPGVENGWFDPATAGLGAHTILYAYTDNNGCENFAEETIFVDVCAGVSESGQAVFRVFPNPVTDRLVIASSGSRDLKVRLFDLTGSVVLSFEKSSSTRIDIDVSSLQNGLYILEVSGADLLFMEKVKVIR